MKVIKELLSSKKFVTGALGVTAWIAARYGFDVNVSELEQPVLIIVAVLLGQGAADFGKNAKAGS